VIKEINGLPEKGGKMVEFNLIKLLEISDKDSLTFSVESSIHLDDFKNLLESNNWEKVSDESESECCGNFIVVYKKGTYEVTLFCDPDGYVIEFVISNKRV
jgi:hypothetical protein